MADFDLSWIDDEERLLSDNSLIKEPIRQIKTVYLYLNQYDYIETIKKEDYVIDPSSSILVTDDLLYLIETHTKITLTSKYKLCDLFFYHVDILYQDIQSYSNNEMETSFFKPVSLTNSLSIPPSLFVFHPVTTLYFVYQEYPYSINRSIKPIIKASNNESNNNDKSGSNNNDAGNDESNNNNAGNDESGSNNAGNDNDADNDAGKGRGKSKRVRIQLPNNKTKKTILRI
uniref:Uncharacterized protein n=1 Tax=viral metagenome TaxID=1070528 RepID=A0A6C0I352_9ZZZZ